MDFNYYDIRVGDYVETRHGSIGYVTKVKDDVMTYLIIKSDNEEYENSYWKILIPFINKHFKRVGQYAFVRDKVGNRRIVEDVIKERK